MEMWNQIVAMVAYLCKHTKQIIEFWREEQKRTISAIWEAYKKTLNTPYRKLTEAEKKLGDLFMRYVLEINAEGGKIYYKTPYETFVY